jgi:hypothetical protein
MQASFGQYAATAGEPASGLRLIRDASARLPRSAPNTARAWLACLEAVALGYLGDRAALRFLGDAQRYADADGAVEPVWPWVFQFDSARIEGYRAITAGRLGQPKIAADAFARAGSLVRSPKQAALATVEHARSLVTAGHLDQACSLAANAYQVGNTYDSERVRQAVREFRSLLGRQPSPVTVQLDDRLHSTYSVRPS